MKSLLSTASVLALLTGGAFAQGMNPTTNQMPGTPASPVQPPAIFVDTADALLILEALLTLLALGGLILIGLSRDFTWRSVDAALFLICFSLALANLKHYFDRQEGGR